MLTVLERSPETTLTEGRKEQHWRCVSEMPICNDSRTTRLHETGRSDRRAGLPPNQKCARLQVWSQPACVSSEKVLALFLPFVVFRLG